MYRVSSIMIHNLNCVLHMSFQRCMQYSAHDYVIMETDYFMSRSSMKQHSCHDDVMITWSSLAGVNDYFKKLVAGQAVWPLYLRCPAMNMSCPSHTPSPNISENIKEFSKFFKWPFRQPETENVSILMQFLAPHGSPAYGVVKAWLNTEAHIDSVWNFHW